VNELLGSDFTLIGTVLAGLALTSLAILRDLGALRFVAFPANTLSTVPVQLEPRPTLD
jgi:hypothetical protein